ncbi:AsmA family protein [Flavobacterium microcysteis]|uniref:AsmA family protein n=1 Tax=Flavobacterium microcysteis TaxID=2596891 RepID=A0A501Q3V2_9FLAO|nr:AsmA family protein [Flavobacterium microcysteis]
MPRWVRISLRVLSGIFLLIVITYLGLAFYVNTHKEEILASVNKKINENINGKFTAESIEPTFLQGFPRVSLRIKNVTLKDSLWDSHKNTLLEAEDFNISINILAFLRGTLEVKKIDINDAKIHLFIAENGYSNTAIFKPKQEKETTGESSSFAEIKAFNLHNVIFISENLKGKKLFEFSINELKGRLDYNSKGWEAAVNLDASAQSLAFNTVHGSFIKDKTLNGKLDIVYDEKAETIVFEPNDLEIGSDNFNIGGKFSIGKTKSDFSLHIKADNILWKNASNLLSNNISRQLNRFDLEKPIDVNCDIIGDLNAEGDPLFLVKAVVKNNRLHIPDGIIDNCSFNGMYTNELVKGKGFDDPNSVVKLMNFKGAYKEIPFVMDSAIINDFSKPIVSGVFKANFPLEKLNNCVDKDLMAFSKGNANVELHFKADVVDFEITKPFVSGLVKIDNGDMRYVPRNLVFKNTNVALNFTDKDLFISNIRLQSGKSIVNMEGSIQNFLNLYYTEPEKLVLNWKVTSPQLYLGEFLGFLENRKTVKHAPVKTKKGNGNDKLDFLFEKSNVALSVQIDKFYYNKFTATNTKADLLLSDSGITIRNAVVNHAGGQVKLNGSVQQGKTKNHFSIKANVSNVAIEKFFYAFNDFDMESLKSKNLKGYLTTAAAISGAISNEGKLIPKSMDGMVGFTLKNGALLKFEPIKSAGKFAFPFRDLDTITFSNLKGNLDISGEKITIHPMQINSSVLNMDVAGIYSFGKGTNIALDVPLRNPKNDKGITDKEKLEERRNRGIVLHLLASDGDDGKIKIRLVSKKTRNEEVDLKSNKQ